MKDAYIFDAVRTPRAKGRPDGALAGVHPVELITQLLRALEQRNGVDAVHRAERLTLGCVGQVGAQGGHIALTARVRAGLPDSVACFSLNNFCVSGLSALADAARAVRCGEAELALAGGVESASAVPFLADRADYYTDMDLAAAMAWAPVGLAADLLATVKGLDRGALDAAVLRSHRRAHQAWADGRFAGRVVPVRDAQGAVLLDRDECVRAFGEDASFDALAPVFAKIGDSGYSAILLSAFPDHARIEHMHTVAHCPPPADGASLLLVGSLEAGRALGLTPLARVRAVAEASSDHALQLEGGFAAMERVLGRGGLGLAQVGAVEFMEAFAAPAALFARDYECDPERTNPNGGHLAMGHPMGATGAILTTALIDDLTQLDAETGLVVATGGSGVGAAALLERV